MPEAIRTFTETQLTAPGVTPARSFAGMRAATCWVTVAAINTNVAIAVEGRPNAGGTFSALSSATITQNGTTTYTITAPAEALRFNFVSESGGTAATIDVNWTMTGDL